MAAAAAQSGAHLSSAGASEAPSVFEVLAQESLMEALRPALRHALKVLAESSPARLGFLWRRFDELYLVLDLLLQNHFLSRCGASFSENFYGLKRVAAGGGGGAAAAGPGLSGSTLRRSLLLLCAAPYLRAKLEAALARQRDHDDFSIQLGGGGRRRRLARAAAAALPYLSGAARLWAVAQLLLFVFGLSRTHSPLLWLGRVTLARAGAHDLAGLQRGGGATAHDVTGNSLVQRAWWMMSQALGGVSVSLSSSVSLGVFFLQFLDWFYSSENASALKALTSLPAPPPPLHLREEEGEGPGGRSLAKGACPLCGRPSANATVLSTSGFVFCYRCIFVYVKSQRRCPVTGVQSEPQHLVKIYAPDT